LLKTPIRLITIHVNLKTRRVRYVNRPISFSHIEVNKSDKLKEITPSRQIDNIVGVGGVTIKKRLLRQYKVYLLEGTSRQSSSQQKCLVKCLQTEEIQQFCFLLAVVSADLTLWESRAGIEQWNKN